MKNVDEVTHLIKLAYVRIENEYLSPTHGTFRFVEHCFDKHVVKKFILNKAIKEVAKNHSKINGLLLMEVINKLNKEIENEYK